jgi:hypothetical protein
VITRASANADLSHELGKRGEGPGGRATIPIHLYYRVSMAHAGNPTGTGREERKDTVN